MSDQRSDTEADTFLKAFSVHAERGAALGAVAALDHLLGEALKSRFIDAPDVKSQMFSEVGPLGNFGVRIRLGYLMGLYREPSYKDLITLSKIRNVFAHTSEATTFKYPVVQGHCSNVLRLREIKVMDADHPSPGLESVARVAKQEGWDHRQDRFAFQLTVFWFATHLMKMRLLAPLGFQSGF